MRLREFSKTVSNAVLRSVGRVASNVQENRPIPVDLLESEDAFLAVFDAAGAKQTDVQVRFSEGTLHVRIDRFRDHHEGFETVSPGRGLSLDGSVDFPKGAAVDPEAATATITENGTLEVLVPKRDVEDETADDEMLDAET